MKLLPFLALLLVTVSAQAKMAAARWERATEEERHQLTRGERYFDQREYKSALSEYELFLQLYPRSEVASYAQLMFAECTRQAGQVNNAINEFRNVIDYFPDSIDAGTAQYSIGVCQTQAGDAEKAIKSFEAVIEKWPKEEFGGLARQEACTIYWRLGQVEKWIPQMEYLAKGEYADTQNIHRAAEHRLIMHRIVEGKLPEARALVHETKGKDPLVSFAERCAEAFRPEYILTVYGEKVKKTLPGMATATVAFIEKQSPQMTDAAQRPALDPLCARIYARGGVPDKANERYALLVKQFPDNDVFRLEYAQHVRATGKKNEARLIYHDMKDQYVADREIAETYGEENNWKSCIEAYQAMLSKHPDKVGAIQWTLGEVLYRNLHRCPEAIAAYQQSQREPESLFRIADCQAELKQYDAALQSLVSVQNFFKESAPRAQYSMAAVYAAKGDKDAAIRTLKTVCKVHLNTPWAGRAHQDLSSTYGVDVTLGGAAKKDDK
ncbi:MAG TPA: tetratricopeptide repeat protein [Chthoniobacteraceae bacterium]|jgi:tetratricopeptide (TPR) repeat protein|nr:tetratricopeptide repeat protein [Chthoniobacteraceae bacterium]